MLVNYHTPIIKKSYKKTGFYACLPGGVGPMTIAMLLQNMVRLAQNN
ncbi:hypothetical protein KJ969_03525 [Patescibacteria group bacterium]|nr:hypothetical protein [Patescibacteria group bacterium]MBU1922569.1 hypothetical protein [Patescibacteria group bacterium]